MIGADPTIQAKIQHLDQGDRLVVANGGKVEIAAGATIEVSGTATMLGMVPKPPSADGQYVLKVLSGVLSWVAETP